MTMKEIEELTSLLGGKKNVLTSDYHRHRLMPTQFNHQNQNNYPLQGEKTTNIVVITSVVLL